MGPDYDGKVIKERGKQRLAGIEPTTSRLQGKCSTAALQPRLRMLSQKQMHPTKKVREVVFKSCRVLAFLSFYYIVRASLSRSLEEVQHFYFPYLKKNSKAMLQLMAYLVKMKSTCQEKLN